MFDGRFDVVNVVLARDWVDYAALIVTAVAATGTLFAVFVAVRVARRDSAERIRTQAAAVSAWNASMDTRVPGASLSMVVVENSSSSAIYDVLMTWAGSWGTPKPDSPEYAGTVRISMIPPGPWYLTLAENPGAAMDARIGILMEFRDGAGLRWMRTANGELRRIRRSAWLANETREVNKPGEVLTRIARS